MFFIKGKNFDAFVDEAYENANGVLLDVRTKEEFRNGHTLVDIKNKLRPTLKVGFFDNTRTPQSVWCL